MSAVPTRGSPKISSSSSASSSPAARARPLCSTRANTRDAAGRDGGRQAVGRRAHAVWAADGVQGHGEPPQSASWPAPGQPLPQPARLRRVGAAAARLRWRSDWGHLPGRALLRAAAAPRARPLAGAHRRGRGGSRTRSGKTRATTSRSPAPTARRRPTPWSAPSRRRRTAPARS